VVKAKAGSDWRINLEEGTAAPRVARHIALTCHKSTALRRSFCLAHAHAVRWRSLSRTSGLSHRLARVLLIALGRKTGEGSRS